tara:strand:- start:124 stop:228 length:105 start_codon:yes stop_codon:yes gene_type:complete
VGAHEVHPAAACGERGELLLLGNVAGRNVQGGAE